MILQHDHKNHVDSSAADAVYTCSERKLIQEKHCNLGLTLKLLTRRTSVVSLVNRFGHCAGDKTVRRTYINLEREKETSRDWPFLG